MADITIRNTGKLHEPSDTGAATPQVRIYTVGAIALWSSPVALYRFFTKEERRCPYSFQSEHTHELRSS